MGEIKAFRYRTQKQVGQPIGMTLAPLAKLALDTACDRTHQSRGAIVSDLILRGLPIPEPGRAGAPGGGAA